MEKVNDKINVIVSELFNESVDAEVTQTSEAFGDYASNIALRLAKAS